MKLISSRVYVCLMMLFALVCGAQTAMADNVLTVKPFSVDGNKTVNVPVDLENSDAVTQLQFDVVLPVFLELDKTGPIKNNDRLTQHQLKYTAYPKELDPETGVRHNRYRILVFSLDGSAIVGNQGEILALPIKANENFTSGNPVDPDMVINNIVMTDKAAQELTAPDVVVKVSMLNATLYTEAAEFIITPGATKNFTVCLNNNFNAYGIEFDVKVPDGFKINENSYVTSDRCSDEAAPRLTYIEDLGVYRFLLFGYTESAIISKGEGAIVTFEVTAPEAIAEGSEIVVNNGLLSYVITSSNIVGVEAQGMSVAIVNGKIALDKANTEVTALEEALKTALETIETECPDVKDDFKGEEIAAAIETLKEAIEAAFNDGTLTPNYDTVMAPVETISSDIETLVSDAKAAQAAYEDAQRKAANEAAYNKTIEELDALQAAIDQAKADIAKEYPGVDVSEYINKAQEALDAIREAADEAYAAVETEGTYEFEVDAEPVETAIADAKDQAARLSSADAAYAQDIAKLDDLQQQLNMTKTVVAITYPGVDVSDKTKAAQDAIDAARKAAKDALDAAKEEGAYDYELPVEEIEAAINAIPAEAKRLQTNEAAYKNAAKTVDQLEKKLDVTYDKIIEEFPEATTDEEVKAAYEAAKEAIAQARTDANEAYAAVITEGDYDYEVPVDEIEALITAIRVAAEQAGINDITVDNIPEDYRMYNLQGVEVENPAAGSVVIIRNSKGISRKVLVM